MLPAFRQPARRRGVTLIEVVIAIFVLSVGIVGILSLFPTGYRLTRKAVERSIAALAARHAEARIYALLNYIKAPSLALEPLYSVPESRRTGTIFQVNANSLVCRVLGDQSPTWTVSLTNYYCVMTSGAAEGHLYKITGVTNNDTLNFTARFNQANERQYEQVRVGDTFALIGMTDPTATKCYPANFLGGALPGISVPEKGADPEKNETRAMPVATYGDAGQNKDLWRYSYGCVLTCPTPERPDMCRLDIFVYSGFPYRASYADPSAVNSIVVGRHVAQIPAGKKQ